VSTVGGRRGEAGEVEKQWVGKEATLDFVGWRGTFAIPPLAAHPFRQAHVNRTQSDTITITHPLLVRLLATSKGARCVWRGTCIFMIQYWFWTLQVGGMSARSSDADFSVSVSASVLALVFGVGVGVMIKSAHFQLETIKILPASGAFPTIPGYVLCLTKGKKGKGEMRFLG